ncbi:MAG: hypothetical protein ACW99A_16635 [Candidatus Kariarchaeaceae archaeon]|jgi:hypothetical protein
MATSEFDYYKNLRYEPTTHSKAAKVFGTIAATLILHQILMLFINFWSFGG